MSVMADAPRLTLYVTSEALESALHDAHKVVEFLGDDFARGAEDALLWLSGRGLAPLSGAAAPTESSALNRELGLAEDAIYGRPTDLSRDYVVGVENAVRWAQGRSPSPPL